MSTDDYGWQYTSGGRPPPSPWSVGGSLKNRVSLGHVELIMVKKKVPQPPESLQSLVGDAIFEAWLETLRALVPDGRTHRLAVVVAGMLQQAALVAGKLPRSQRRGVLVEALLDPEAGSEAASSYTPHDGPNLPLEGIVDGLFDAARVQHERVNARGDGYSVVSSVVYEYLHWFDMPWE